MLDEWMSISRFGASFSHSGNPINTCTATAVYMVCLLPLPATYPFMLRQTLPLRKSAGAWAGSIT